ncbi:putative UPF0481 protein At3g02645 [Alnus glutinosa]|uniref:putative UPF0481 protein At3g02645 n=1 Tax=Alnus glutinosa TaxID=3517 RepID=UPI002D77B71B|nr:putative UPF0481 protein At3g02645 [Alnus glutinosa]
MAESASAEIQEEWEANGASGNESQNGEVDTEANLLDRALANNIALMLESSEPLLSSKCCIYKVPTDLRKLNEEAYTPEVISIGHFHRGDERLKTMERLKVTYFKIFVKKVKLNVENLVTTIRAREACIRHCYSHTSGLSSDDYVKMILLDASFIIVVFHLFYDEEWRRCYNLTTFSLRLIVIVMRDICLLENQLPFFIIEELYNLAFPSHLNYRSFTQLAYGIFEILVRELFSLQIEPTMSPYPDFKIMHFADLLRTFSLPQSQRPQQRNLGDQIIHLYSASQLDEAGVKFKVGSSKCLFDLKFTNGVLEIPCLKIDDDTESIFRNLMALEQCHYAFDHYITDYICILDFLIDTDKDVDLLVRNGILVHTLGNNNAVTSFVNKLSQRICSSEMNSNYSCLCEKLNTFYKVRCHRWKATLRRDYFKTPWRTASTIAAIILLLFTFIQTICSIISL